MKKKLKFFDPDRHRTLYNVSSKHFLALLSNHLIAMRAPPFTCILLSNIFFRQVCLSKRQKVVSLFELFFINRVATSKMKVASSVFFIIQAYIGIHNYLKSGKCSISI